MNPFRTFGARILVGAAIFAIFFTLPAQAQPQGAATYEVLRGDTLFGVARKAKHDGVTRNQMILAIWRANRSAFPGGNPNLLEVGTVLVIPPKAAVAAIDSAEADRQVRELLARPAGPAPSMASIKPQEPAAVPAPGASLGREEAARRRYREGLALERKGNHAGAFKAFLEAGESGHGLAQRRLGEIYDTGSPVVKHDYQASLKWYQKAREQGVEIPKPIQRGPVH
jgi:FimV-like protein